MKRRSFIKMALAAGVFPLLPGCAAGARKYVVNGKVRLAAIGCGCQAWGDLTELAKNSDICEVVALCDTDLGAPQTQAALKKFPSLPKYRDFRRMFDMMADKIDAVLVGTPDHSHFCAAMHAMRLGKHVYVEKPLAHSFRECALLMKAEKDCGVVCQMGNQGHSGDNFFQYRDYAAAGVVKDVTRVVAHMNMERRWHKWGGKIAGWPKAEYIPKTLDWECWLSAAPHHDYSKAYTGGEWRCWFDYGNGCMGDWGAHILDTVHRFTLGGELPTEVRIEDLAGWNPYVFPMQDTLYMDFPASRNHSHDITLEWREGLRNLPKLPEGFAYADNKGLFPASSANNGLAEPKLKPGKEIYQADGTVWQGLSHSSPLRRVGGGEMPEYEKAGDSHYRNFLRAVKGECAAHSPFSVTGPLSQIFCLGVAAQRLGRGFKFDPAAGKAIGDDEVNMLLRGLEPRKGWEEYYS